MAKVFPVIALFLVLVLVLAFLPQSEPASPTALTMADDAGTYAKALKGLGFLALGVLAVVFFVFRGRS